MKMIVSDFDNTFFTEGDIDKNILATQKFMEDNLFVMATGRSYLSYKKMQQIYGIKSNYLIINHGATILKDNKILYNFPIEDTLKNKIVVDLKTERIESAFACSGLESRSSIDRVNLTKIHVKYNDVITAKRVMEKLLKKYNKEIYCYSSEQKKALEIISKKANKGRAVVLIAKLENIDKKDIYTIGDSYNDLEMIKMFNGYAMLKSVEEVKMIAFKKYSSVYKLIADINNKKC